MIIFIFYFTLANANSAYNPYMTILEFSIFHFSWRYLINILLHWALNVKEK